MRIKKDLNTIRKYFNNLNITQRILILFVVFNLLIYLNGDTDFYKFIGEDKRLFFYQDFTLIITALSILAFFLFSNISGKK